MPSAPDHAELCAAVTPETLHRSWYTAQLSEQLTADPGVPSCAELPYATAELRVEKDSAMATLRARAAARPGWDLVARRQHSDKPDSRVSMLAETELKLGCAITKSRAGACRQRGDLSPCGQSPMDF